MKKTADLIDTSFFTAILPLITTMRPPVRYIEINIPMGLAVERGQVLTYFETDAISKFTRRDGKIEHKLSGTIKDQVVFDYLYSQYSKQRTIK